MKYKLTIGKGVSGKVLPDDVIEDFERPKFGRYWWFWLPRLKWNKGRFSRGEIVDTGVMWLCFWLDFTFWPNHCAPDKDSKPKGT